MSLKKDAELAEREEQKKKLLYIKDKAISRGKTPNIFPVQDTDYFTLCCKAESENKRDSILGYVVYTFYQEYDSTDAVVFIFSLPTYEKEEVNKEIKHVSQKVLEILKLVEDVFIIVDHMEVKNVREDKFTYFTVIKKI